MAAIRHPDRVAGLVLDSVMPNSAAFPGKPPKRYGVRSVSDAEKEMLGVLVPRKYAARG
jgi:pimeloyl-ACP methyl ester carboxylesterase